ncbi:MAG: hypothetical protein JNK82_23690 [Myxococcaceae bacterium]|nr:hypothetical protein [Myxococcaceae bacterium]
MRTCPSCGKAESGLARGECCEHCMAPLPGPPELTRRCYSCNRPFASTESDPQRMCEVCRAKVPAEAPAAPESEPGSPVTKAFFTGLLAGPVAGVAILVIRAFWQTSPALVICPMIALGALGGLLGPVRRREPLADRVAGLVGALLSLIATGFAYELWRHGG